MGTQLIDLPNELILLLPPLLPLKSLITFRSLNQRIRALTDAFASQIDPIRRKLLHLYLEVISSPAFLASRHLFLPSLNDLTDLDREEYVEGRELMMRDNHRIPEELRVWLLEWPAKAVTSWIWPWLDTTPPHLSPLPTPASSLQEGEPDSVTATVTTSRRYFFLYRLAQPSLPISREHSKLDLCLVWRDLSWFLLQRLRGTPRPLISAPQPIFLTCNQH